MSNYRVKLKKREEVAQQTMAFYFERPPQFQFKPGQSIDLTLLEPRETDAEGNTRSFSIASAPFEDHIMVATRMRDTAFKRVLKSLPTVTELQVEGPMGSFILHKNPDKAAVFLAGGIGITPFLSMLRDATHEGLPQRIYLFYSNRRPEDAAFLEELQGMETRNRRFHLVPTMTDISASQRPWKGELGYVDRDMLARHLLGLNGPIYYAAGPPAMVAAMRKMLVDAKVDEDDIRSEDFAGY